MEIQVQSSTIIPQLNSEAEPTESPLTIFDRFASDIHIAFLYVYKAPTPENTILNESLIKTLAYFPTLTGRLGRSKQDGKRPCLFVGGSGGGALLVEATVNSELKDHLRFEPHPDFQFLHPPCIGTGEDGPPQLLQVQLNRFACGGIIIGVTAHHRVADGRSMSMFFDAWCQTVRNVRINPLPSYDKSWLVPRSPPKPQFDHFEYEFIPKLPHRNRFLPHHIDTNPQNVTSLRLRFSREFITTELKANVVGKFTTFEVLLGHVWRKITIARALEDDVVTSVRVAVNGRPRLKRNVPLSEFFGNLVLYAYPTTNAKRLVEGGLEEAAGIVHEAIMRVDNDYFQSFIDFGAVNENEELVTDYDSEGMLLLPHLQMASLIGFRFHDLDFGGGSVLCAFLPTWVPMDGLMLFVPSTGEDGGVDVFVGLKEEHATVLRQISHSLD